MSRLADRTTVLRTAAIAFWLASVVSGMALLSAYAGTAGTPASAPSAWPGASTIGRRADVATILVFAHPNCPCTRATLGEIDWLLAHASHPADVHVLLWEPESAGRTWADTRLAELAAAIPGVQIARDTGGREAARFGVATSGQVLFYDAADRLRFAGGITGGRGHAGANPGRDELLQHLNTASATTTAAPVFGCGLGAPPTT